MLKRSNAEGRQSLWGFPRPEDHLDRQYNIIILPAGQNLEKKFAKCRQWDTQIQKVVDQRHVLSDIGTTVSDTCLVVTELTGYPSSKFVTINLKKICM